jgi:membrane protein DedA with SNARE-associated domain
MEFLVTLKLFFGHIIQWLHLNPGWAGFVTFLIALSESLAVIGLLIPGTVIMAAVGTLIGAQIIPAWQTIAWAIAGAVVGDALSYRLGYHFKDHLRDIWPFKRYPQLLATGEKFFTTHGGKSVFLGRFVGPIRPIIPVIAGMLRMETHRFFLSNICSAFLWAPVYMLPGILIGAASLELEPKTATHFLVSTIAILLSICVTAWFFQYLSRYLLRFLDKKMSALWQRLQHHPSSQIFCRWIANPEKPHSHAQLTLLIIAFILLLLLITLTLCKLYSPAVANMNHAVYYFFRSIQGTSFTQFFVAVTLLGFRLFLAPVVLIIGLYAFFHPPARRAFLFLFGVLLLTSITIVLSKMLFISPRPNGLSGVVSTNSFPSGHTTMSIVFYTSIAVIIHPLLSQGAKHFSTILVCLLCLLIGISRLYLEVHWITDVIAGLLLGGLLVTIGTIFYRRYPTSRMAIKPFFSLIFLSLLISWLIAMHLYFEKLTTRYTAYWPSSKMTLNQWWQQSSPIYLYSRTGKPIKLFNIQWLASIKDIKKSLQNNGWEQVPKLTLASTINRISSEDQTEHLPLSPKVFAGEKPILFMYKPLKEQNALLVLQLWRANIQLNNSDLPLWFGLIDYKLPSPHNWWKRRQNAQLKKKLDPATLHTHPLLNQFHWRHICYPSALRPEKAISRRQWQAGIMLLAPKNIRLPATPDLPCD